jgi:Na+/H+ antiporter NhaD/arsenite permease-like protein
MSFKHFPLIASGSVLLAAFIVSFVFPRIPGYVYLAVALVAGTVILLVTRKITKDSKKIRWRHHI